MKARRALISLFDRERQHVVAEATRQSPLAAKECLNWEGKRGSEVDTSQNSSVDHHDDDSFWLCGTAIPRSFGICEHVLFLSANNGTNTVMSEPATAESAELPISVIPDLNDDARFQDRPYIHGQPFNRFYAGVPIRTPGPNGVNIGVYCIFDTQPRPEGLSSDEMKFMQDMSRTTMSYLECRASNGRYRRSERMVRGMGNFVQGLDSLTATGGAPSRGSGHSRKKSSRLIDLAEVASGGRKAGSMLIRPRRPEPLSKGIGLGSRVLDDALLSPHTTNPMPPSKDFSTSNKGSPLLEPSSAASIPGHRTSMSLAPDDSSRSSTPRPESQQSGESSPRPAVLSQVSTADLQLVETGRVFAKAANIIRQSLDVDGVLFLDATVRSFGGLVGQQSERKVSAVGIENLNYLSNDDETTSQAQSEASKDDFCNVLGYSTTQGSSISDDRAPLEFEGLRDKTLQRLLRRHPNGRIFNFEADGQVLHPPTLDREPPTPGLPPRRPASPTRQWSTDSQSPQELRLRSMTVAEDLPTIQKQRTSAVESVINLFPGARSVVIIPLWDGQKKRWAAGGFVWTKSATRVFTTDDTLGFLRVFGLIVMAEIYRLNTVQEETIKSNILGSISHELRSPLHGLVGAVELLHDSRLDAVQQNVLNIIETSGKTLVDTINHLLDYSKINSFIENDKKDTFLGKVGAEPKDRTGPKTSSGVTTELDCLVEEVVESVLAGFSHERVSGPRPSRDVTEYSKYSDIAADSQPSQPLPGDRVQIYLDMDPAPSWRFHTHPGAFRRIVMNLFGNSLKFTRSGFIKISLAQEPAKPYQQNSRASVLLTVEDSGKGISEDYLHNRLFTPFCQEDHFAPGTGLGLSLVRQIAVNLGGEVKVVSQVGRGTTITVSLPLPYVGDTPEPEDPTGSRKDIKRLKGTQVLLRGFEGLQSLEGLPSTHRPDGVGKLIESQTYFLQSTFRNWLQMHILSEDEARIQTPGFVVHHDSTLSFREAEKIAVRAPCPVLFVCEASVAVRNFSCNLPDANSRIRTFEFTSPPLGPRKLARILVHLLEMWRVKQARNEPVHHTTSVEVLPTSKESKSLNMMGKEALVAAQEIEFGNNITLVKSTRTSLGASQMAHKNKASPLPTPPEEPRTNDPMARTEASTQAAAPTVGDSEGKGPAVLIADDNAINLRVSRTQKTNRLGPGLRVDGGWTPRLTELIV